ncbi:MAG: hypothetical protein NPIRA04_14860 [Nitrospirales bacterium]|nr:MAG: hypothetical protein NPIRA04_14860 [Nitrospirales bacterium]
MYVAKDSNEMQTDTRRLFIISIFSTTSFHEAQEIFIDVDRGDRHVDSNLIVAHAVLF